VVGSEFLAGRAPGALALVLLPKRSPCHIPPTRHIQRGRPLPRARAPRLLPGRLHQAVMLAHGFTIELMVELIRAGLATAGRAKP
jgi:hypothetical protein